VVTYVVIVMDNPMVVDGIAVDAASYYNPKVGILEVEVGIVRDKDLTFHTVAIHMVLIKLSGKQEA
jgi:hypothetical protein